MENQARKADEFLGHELSKHHRDQILREIESIEKRLAEIKNEAQELQQWRDQAKKMVAYPGEKATGQQ